MNSNFNASLETQMSFPIFLKMMYKYFFQRFVKKGFSPPYQQAASAPQLHYDKFMTRVQ